MNLDFRATIAFHFSYLSVSSNYKNRINIHDGAVKNEEVDISQCSFGHKVGTQ